MNGSDVDDEGLELSIRDESGNWAEPIPFPEYSEEPPAEPSPQAAPSSRPPQPSADRDGPRPESIIVDDDDGGIGKRIIVGDDNRVLVTDLRNVPWSAVCLLAVTHQNGSRTTATGFLIKPTLVATAAHVLHNPDLGYGHARSINVIPGYMQPTGSRRAQTSTKFRIQKDWGNPPQKAFLPWFDYGAILLDDPAKFVRYGLFNMVALNRSDLRSRDLQLSGYPGEREKRGRQYVGSGRIREHFEEHHDTFFHPIDSTPGQSGAPMFYTEGANAIAAALHSKSSSDMANRNVGRRVTQQMINDYARWYSEHVATLPLS